MAGNEWVFLSRQRADFEDLGYPRAWETRFARANLQSKVARKRVIEEVFWVTLGSPRSARGLFWPAHGLLLAAAACSWSPLLSPWLSCCSPGVSCYNVALLQGAIFVIKSFVRFGSVLGFGGTSKQHFWCQGIQMLQNRSTKPCGDTSEQVAAGLVAPSRLPGSKPSNQKTLHLEDGRE